MMHDDANERRSHANESEIHLLVDARVSPSVPCHTNDELQWLLDSTRIIRLSWILFFVRFSTTIITILWVDLFCDWMCELWHQFVCSPCMTRGFHLQSVFPFKKNNHWIDDDQWLAQCDNGHVCRCISSSAMNEILTEDDTRCRSHWNLIWVEPTNEYKKRKQKQTHVRRVFCSQNWNLSFQCHVMSTQKPVQSLRRHISHIYWTKNSNSFRFSGCVLWCVRYNLLRNISEKWNICNQFSSGNSKKTHAHTNDKCYYVSACAVNNNRNLVSSVRRQRVWWRRLCRLHLHLFWIRLCVSSKQIVKFRDNNNAGVESLARSRTVSQFVLTLMVWHDRVPVIHETSLSKYLHRTCPQYISCVISSSPFFHMAHVLCTLLETLFWVYRVFQIIVDAAVDDECLNLVRSFDQ